ncbi:MAG: tRNA (adenosine(37)-N6)-threonylcarbamoyltransferase complex ATPase subunit type 1 TsaE [Calditerrivibrio sp.]|nr:tRNA (adenosine(37)-N6)-threonylcarbamoyltransferase complex ATPase subunit type 1 TsaE [Calditerrivibrio sp.]
MKYNINSVEELEKIIIDNIDIFKNNKIFLNGELGAGKTTFVKLLVKILGFNDANSPTFTIINRYLNGSEVFIHMDLYRLDSLNELENIGFFDYIDKNWTIAIEWADKFDLKRYIESYVEVFITKISQNEREITIINKGD